MTEILTDVRYIFVMPVKVTVTGAISDPRVPRKAPTGGGTGRATRSLDSQVKREPAGTVLNNMLCK